MLLSEQVRHVKDEKILIDDPTTYDSGKSLNWGTVHDYGNITLDEACLIIFSYTIQTYGDGGYQNSESANHRLLFGSNYASGFPVGRGVTKTVTGMIWLPAGTYDVSVQGKTDYYDGNNYTAIRISSVKVGKAAFPDLESSPLAEYSAVISKTLAQRKLAVGTVKNGMLHVQVFAYSVYSGSYIATTFYDTGTSGVRIYVDGVQQAWTEKHNDNYSGQYGAGTAKLVIPLSAGTSHTVEIQKPAEATVWISLVYTPWILGQSDLEPLNLDFPQGSTLYIVTEPLMSNPTKNVKIGKTRGISFGDATDYYSTASGTDILSHSYTFETVEVANCILLANGYGGCISIIGVDVR